MFWEYCPSGQGKQTVSWTLVHGVFKRVPEKSPQKKDDKVSGAHSVRHKWAMKKNALILYIIAKLDIIYIL